jgi:hypothetical protein
MISNRTFPLCLFLSTSYHTCSTHLAVGLMLLTARFLKRILIDQHACNLQIVLGVVNSA